MALETPATPSATRGSTGHRRRGCRPPPRATRAHDDRLPVNKRMVRFDNAVCVKWVNVRCSGIPDKPPTTGTRSVTPNRTAGLVCSKEIGESCRSAQEMKEASDIGSMSAGLRCCRTCECRRVLWCESVRLPAKAEGFSRQLLDCSTQSLTSCGFITDRRCSKQTSIDIGTTRQSQ